MNIVRRYIARELISAWLMMTLIFGAVFSLLMLIDEIDQVNERYTVAQVLLFLIRTLPTRVVDLAPVCALLGTLVALGNLSRHSEIIVLRACGVSELKIVAGTWLPIVVMVVLIALFSEFVAAPLHQQAETEKQVLRSGRLELLPGQGLWATDRDRFVNVRSFRLGHIPQGIELFQFDESGQLLHYLFGREAELTGDRQWTLKGVRHKELKKGVLRTRSEKQLDIGPFWLQEELPVLALSPTGMAPSALFEYIDYLDSTGQNSERFRFVLWQKLVVPLATAAMVLLAAPIGTGLRHSRGGGVGAQLALGAIVGIGFYMLSQIFYNTGLILGLPAPLVALLPTGLIAAAGSWLLARKA